MAAESVDRISRRHTERLARLERSAGMWDGAATGDRATANALKGLPADTWTVLHDLRWPGRPFAGIDHLAIGPSGAYVIESKDWSGRVRLGDGVLRHNGRQRSREVLSATEAAAAICRRFPHLPAAWVTPVLCLLGCEVAGMAGPVAVCNKSNLAEMLTSRPPVLSPEGVEGLVNDLRLKLRSRTPAHRPPRDRSTPTGGHW